ncbi:hypothetical protein EZS27_004524 [termite gut metagenome]|uniref:Uncharacterized protein n=1 Tax=termite gut metagenome TaxID=433724 RepID=A0A5J4SQG7_9ZZZZ
MITNEILTAEQIKNLRELGVTIPDEVTISLSDMINLILSEGHPILLESQGDEGIFAESGGSWSIREDAVSAVYALLCNLIIGKEIGSNIIIF